MVNAEEEFQRRVENLEKQRQAAVNNYADFAKEFRATVARRMEEFERELKKSQEIVEKARQRGEARAAEKFRSDRIDNASSLRGMAPDRGRRGRVKSVLRRV
ncbi:hypothetical protein [Corynebacterium pseudotuberculosis]|uniref:Uncharacterized protein n=1 Tax=Corynebacterium pseudotuberculosis (strain C231) TaxID=681645 RepID=D9QEI0_CORP2|nr:hypothetical protein [Corynebacterium pseudotuberculosis]ADK28202.1 hypothetical protein CPFRC_02080 [Corynebacterium pseudotuberculosis FRC41]ADL09903.1 hypothetical protein CPC231_02080 [Corynebacterium pseudotuberculosis C231]ADL20310.1 hypothetical protein CP1002_02080 [Corynebacterium pseudotuberculosis 1002]ADO25695.1 hypothetical protein CPI19_02080 [Corynebacterium pseudotuberculosis I19]AEK91744.1 Hypothetical protein CpPAT10_0414 [Corynebacterium pseudotuberculosis PAT10]